MPRTDANSKLAHEQMLENLKKGRIDVYFAGDSITRRWRATDYPQFLENWKENFFGWNAANFGWGGDTIQNILWRMQNGELDGVHPKLIVLLAGTNNVGNTPASDAKVVAIAKGIKALLDIVREKAPKATIIVMGILPRNDGPKPTAVMPSINKINENIAKLADGKTIRYLNINDKLADKDGKLFEGMTGDRLHLSLKGYQVWADALKPLFTELLGPPAKEDHAPPPTGSTTIAPVTCRIQRCSCGQFPSCANNRGAHGTSARTTACGRPGRPDPERIGRAENADHRSAQPPPPGASSRSRWSHTFPRWSSAASSESCRLARQVGSTPGHSSATSRQRPRSPAEPASTTARPSGWKWRATSAKPSTCQCFVCQIVPGTSTATGLPAGTVAQQSVNPGPRPGPATGHAPIGRIVVQAQQLAQPQVAVHGMDIKTRDADAVAVGDPGAFAGAGPFVGGTPVGTNCRFQRLAARPVEADADGGAPVATVSKAERNWPCRSIMRSWQACRSTAGNRSSPAVADQLRHHWA